MPRIWRVLVIDDQQDNLESAKREIEDVFAENPLPDGATVQVETEIDFAAGFERVRHGDADIVVLDLRRDATPDKAEDNDAGRQLYIDIRAARFAPVIFWTALPMHVMDDAMPPMVTVLQKDETHKIPDAVRLAIESGAVEVIAEVEERVDEVLRQHMWAELSPNWAEYTDGAAGRDEIAHVLITRLARTLESDASLGFSRRPHYRYIYPPVQGTRMPGDILVEAGEHEASWWVVLTPACDFAQQKVEFVLLGRAKPLAEHAKYLSWRAALGEGKNGKDQWNSLRRDVLSATSGRFHYLPQFREIPELVVDLEDVETRRADALSALTAVASLASPYSESLLVQHSQFRGRIGVPDLDHDSVLARHVAELESG